MSESLRPNFQIRSFFYNPPLLVCLVLLTLGMSCSRTLAAEIGKKHAHVLVLSSYHIGYGGTDPMVAGIKTAFMNSGQEVDFYLEYLDTKRFPLQMLSPQLKQLYKEKYAQTEFDIIIVADNNAFDFIRKVRNDLFPKVPVVFCGINNFQDSMLEGFEQVTGVAEDISLKETVELALSIHPDTKYLGVISDSTTTGFANMQKFLEIQEDLPASLVTLDLTNLSATELAEKLESLPENTILLQLSFYMDREGRQFSQKQQMDFIKSHCDNPIYSAWDFFIHFGVTGGVVTYFPFQGKIAGEMAIKIMTGTPISALPVVTKSPNIPLFDYTVLDHFNIPLSALPPGSVILNQPKSLFLKYKTLIRVGLLFLPLLLLVIGVLSIVTRRQKQAGELLLKGKKAYTDLFDNMAEGAFYQTRDGKLSNANPAALRVFGVTREQFVGKTCVNPQWTIFREDGTEVLVGEHPPTVALRTGKAIRNVLAGVYSKATGSETWVIVNAVPQFRDDESKPYQVFVTMHDITTRKHSEELLRIERKMSIKLNSINGLSDGLKVCLESSLHGSGMDAGGIYIVDQNSGGLDLICHKGLSEKFVKKASRLEPDSERYKLIEQKQPIYTSYDELDISLADEKTNDGLKGLCVIPILHQNELVGSLNLASLSNDSMPDFKRIAIETIAGQIGNWVSHHRTVQTLNESQVRFVLAMASVSDGLFDWNLADNSVYYSPSWKRMLGYEEHEIDNNVAEWERLIDPADAKKSWVMFEELIGEKRDHFEIEFKMKHKAGHWVDILSRAKVILDNNGKATRLVGTHVDISERKEFEKSIVEQKQIAERYLNLAGVMFIGIDRHGNVNLANKKACEILEAESEDIIGHNWTDSFLPPKEREHINMVFRKLMEGNVEYSEYNENVIITHNGQEKYVAWQNTVLRDDEGKVTGILCSGEDVTEKKQLQFKLQEVQKMESIGTLAGGIAHDFNNILSSILGFTELSIEDVEKGSQVEENLQEVYSAGKRARDLVKQILTFARRSDEEIKPIQPKAIAKEVLQFIRSSIPTSISIEQELHSDSLIMGNATQMHRIFMNLCTNAAYVMEDDGGLLTVAMKDIVVDQSLHCRRLDLAPGHYIELSISDTGCGIKPESIGKIFEPYFTTKGPGEGTGLGLAMVHGIVESYGGKIKVDSIVAKGTTFTLYLPTTKKRGNSITYTPELAPTGSERVLFVDDEPALAKIGGRILGKLGYEVVTRTSSVEALELFRANPDGFDLVVSDMTMPYLTGDKLAVELMKIRSDIPVIICTGYSKKMSSNLITEIGIKAVAFKPIVKADLAKTLREVLDREKEN